MKKWIAILCMLWMMLLSMWACAESEYRFNIAPDDLSITQGLDKNWTNILLLGLDNRADIDNQGRADAIIIVSLHKKTGQIKMTSLTRDMYVPMGGQQFSDKINAAFSYGGPNMMMKTVNETLLLNIDKYVSINFYSMCDMVDAMGGIDLTLTRAERDTVNEKTEWGYGNERGEDLPYGTGEMTVHLCGAQALAYSRIRRLDSDFGRNQRQRNVMMAIVDKATDLSVMEMMDFVELCLEHVKTNLSLWDITSLGMTALKGGLRDIQQLSLPAQEDFRYVSKGSKSVVEFKLEETRAGAHGFIYGE